MAALLWTWSAEGGLKDRFAQALGLVRRLFPSAAPPGSSYQAFMKLLVRWTRPLRFELVWIFRRRMEREFP